MRASVTALLLMSSAPLQAEVLSGFDAYAGWGQPLPGLLEFASLEFPAYLPDPSLHEGSVASTSLPYPRLRLTAAEGGSTLRALQNIRFDGSITLIGEFTFAAPSIDFVSTARVTVEGGLSLFATNNLEFEAGSLLEFGGPRGSSANDGSHTTSGSVSGAAGGAGLSLGAGLGSPIPTSQSTISVSGGGPWSPIVTGGSTISSSIGVLERSTFDAVTTITAELIFVEIGGVVDETPVPLPATLPLLASGIGLLVARARRR